MNWIRSSSCSAGTCVEVTWISFCANGACVQVAIEEGRVLVRDSKRPDAEPMSLQRSEWMNTVLSPLMAGRLPSMVTEVSDGFEWLGHTVDGDGQRFLFTREEWEAFDKGVVDGEFDTTPWLGLDPTFRDPG
jgi:hypothetical protein